MESIRKQGKPKSGKPFFDVIENVKDGDIVLFRTRRAISSIQRIVCNSEYDHVGIIVAWDQCDPSCCSERLKLARKKSNIKAWHTLEASGNHGVKIYRFTPNCLQSYNGKVFIRHIDVSSLTMAQYSLAVAALHRFVGAVQGMPYESSISNMMHAADLFGPLNNHPNDSPQFHTNVRTSSAVEVQNKKQLLLNPFELEQIPPESRPPVFCSELVAAAYMVMGLLPSDGRDPSMYIPGDFSSGAGDNRNPRFQNGVTFSEEFVINTDDLSYHVKKSRRDCEAKKDEEGAGASSSAVSSNLIFISPDHCSSPSNTPVRVSLQSHST